MEVPKGFVWYHQEYGAFVAYQEIDGGVAHTYKKIFEDIKKDRPKVILLFEFKPN